MPTLNVGITAFGLKYAEYANFGRHRLSRIVFSFIIFFNRCKAKLRACLHGGGGPQLIEVTAFCGVTCLSI